MARFKRIIRHLLLTHWQLRHAFPSVTLECIEREIKIAESAHFGEIRFVVEGALSGPALFTNQSPRERAIDVFSKFRMWDTEHRNGVLIYILLADKAVEIIADRGVHSKTSTPLWEKICREMEDKFRDGYFRDGAVIGVQHVSDLLTQHFPSSGKQHLHFSPRVVLI